MKYLDIPIITKTVSAKSDPNNATMVNVSSHVSKSHHKPKAPTANITNLSSSSNLGLVKSLETEPTSGKAAKRAAPPPLPPVVPPPALFDTSSSPPHIHEMISSSSSTSSHNGDYTDNQNNTTRTMTNVTNVVVTTSRNKNKSGQQTTTAISSSIASSSSNYSSIASSPSSSTTSFVTSQLVAAAIAIESRPSTNSTINLNTTEPVSFHSQSFNSHSVSNSMPYKTLLRVKKVPDSNLRI